MSLMFSSFHSLLIPIEADDNEMSQARLGSNSQIAKNPFKNLDFQHIILKSTCRRLGWLIE